MDKSNYRGINILSCLSKLFTGILNKRITKFLTDNQIIHISQIGFREGHRSCDHVFILKTLIDVYKKRKKAIYTSFID